MERTVALQVVAECCAKMMNLLRASEVGAKGTSEPVPYSDRELLDLLPAVEAEAFEAGKALVRLRKTLCNKLDLNPEEQQ